MTSQLSVRQQVAAMRRAWPRFRCSRIGETANWVGVLQPNSWIQGYRVHIRYWPKRREQEGGVSVRVLEPELKISDAQMREVHVYRSGGLCLFNPHRGEWRPGACVARTIVPWTCEWIFHYEVWLATGEWLGGGDHGTAHLEDG